MIFSFALHRDTPKTLGWRADNLWPATRQAMLVFGAMIVGLVAIGAGLRAPLHLPPNLISWHRLWSYFAFCVLQQVLLNSLVHNRMLSLVTRQWFAAILTGLIFAACHWPNPVLVPLTLIGGIAMAWMFGRYRNIIPLAIGQAILGSLIFWAFPAGMASPSARRPGLLFNVAALVRRHRLPRRHLLQPESNRHRRETK